jgi:hypothetical protein
MRAAKIIDFFPMLPPELPRKPNEPDHLYELRRSAALKESFREVPIRILDEGHSDRTTWDHHVAGAKRSLREVEERSIAWTKELLDLKRPIQRLLREVYTVPELDLRPPAIAGTPTPAPGTFPSSWIEPEVWVIPPLETGISALIRSALTPCSDGAGRFWTSYEIPEGDALRMRASIQTITEVLKFAVSGGFLEFALPDWLNTHDTWSILARQSTTKLLLRSEPSGSEWPGLHIPRVTMLVGGHADQDSLDRAMTVACPAHLILFPTNLHDPRRLDRKISEVVPHISIHNLLSRLQA